ncbi:MAG: hypothetical protein ED555_00570 [Allomuricauda sp.]|nr:MAG: hypothetical protein ED555_00570 [Allomuricauda sp.]
MRSFIPTLLMLLILGVACKEAKKETTNAEVTTLTVSEKIAMAHGYANWGTVEQLNFTFNVDRDSTHFERSWIWKPKTNDVISISGTDTLAYNRNAMDSAAYKVNGGFVNDRYWLLAPFNLIWDAQNIETTHEIGSTAPISGETMQKLTIVYGNEGGYTPGDAYDFYFKDDFLIKEWVFRKANQEEASMMTTWENYMVVDSLTLARDHKRPDSNFNLYFSGVKINAEGN